MLTTQGGGDCSDYNACGSPRVLQSRGHEEVLPEHHGLELRDIGFVTLVQPEPVKSERGVTRESHAILKESQGLARMTGKACSDHLGEKNAWFTVENGNPFPSLGSDDPPLSHISKAPFQTRGTHASWRFPHHRGIAHPTRKTSAENFERVCVLSRV